MLLKNLPINEVWVTIICGENFTSNGPEDDCGIIWAGQKFISTHNCQAPHTVFMFCKFVALLFKKILLKINNI